MSTATLAAVDLKLPNGKLTPGLVAVRGRRRQRLSIDEEAVLRDVQEFNRVDYVLFRRFADDRSSQVAAYVVDNSDDSLNKDDLARLHCDVWRQGVAPLLYVASDTSIDVLTSARGPDFWDMRQQRCIYKPVTTLKQAARVASEIDAGLQEKRKRFSAFRLADGTFWDDPENRKLARHDRGAHRLLIEAVVETDRELGGDKNPVLRRLLMLTVLIKYLEDRKVFPKAWFGRHFCAGARTFLDVLQQGTPNDVRRLLNVLEGKFNGDVFVLPESDKAPLTPRRLRKFAQLVEAKTLKKQRYLWGQFSFEHLPVEVISHLYQRFVTEGHGAVYTPPFLASLLLDHVMPYSSLAGKERILDPACGSGVFLVGAFRRLVNVWRNKNRQASLDVETLKHILENCIFGIDLDNGAVDLAVFSLALAVCDCLKPNVIWKKLRFTRLCGRNILCEDFFGHVAAPQRKQCSAWPRDFDVVVGNPPFESKLSEAGMKLNQSMEEVRGRLPDKQSGYLFLEQGFKVLKVSGRLCLVQPAGFLHNRNTDEFRRSILRKHRLTNILDFISIRKLYDGADPKTIAVCARQHQPGKDNHVLHLVFRRTYSVHQRVGFEMDHYDSHCVPQEVAERDPLIWRINLLGGGRLHEISERLRQLPTLKEYVDSQGWDYGEGFIVGKGGERKPADFLTGKPLLPTSALSEKGIEWGKINDTVEDALFKSPYNEQRFTAPLLLIKEHQSLPLDLVKNGQLAYRDKIVGIHVARRDLPRLRNLHSTLRKHHRFFRFACAIHSSQLWINKATAILKSDIDDLPFTDNLSDIDLAFWEQAILDDVLDYMGEFIRKGQNSHLLKTVAGNTDLDRYANMFCRMLGSVYGNLKSCPPIPCDGIICQPFYFGEEPKVDWVRDRSTKDLRALVYNKSGPQLRTVRRLCLNLENVFLVVKPDRLRYWLQSTAIRDADEALIELRNQGY